MGIIAPLSPFGAHRRVTPAPARMAQAAMFASRIAPEYRREPPISAI